MQKQTQMHFLEKSLEATHNLRTAFDNKASFLLAISGILFVLSVGKMDTAPFAIMAVFSLASAIFCIFSITLPVRSFSEQTKDSLFCYWGIKKMSYQEYTKQLKSRIKTDDDVIKQYTQEIYSLYHNSIRYKLLFIKLAGIYLLVGLLVLFILIIFT